MNKGRAVGGPANGREIESICQRVIVPLPGPDGFTPGLYVWDGDSWIWDGAADLARFEKGMR